jgi:putative endonuclease
VTGNLLRRIWTHKNKHVTGFTERYGVEHLVWYEPHLSVESAITREKQIKKWNRRWKMRLIEERNPEWTDLYETIL